MGAGANVEETTRVNILMVDDQPGKLLTYEAILAGLDANLLKARSGREGLEILLKHDIAVVLLDVSMPEISGFEMADMMRQHPRFQKTAILFISAVRMTDLDRIKGYQSGAVDYISVPVVPEILRAKVGVFAELHRKTRELERLNRELEQRVEERTCQLRESEHLLRVRADLLELATEAIFVRDEKSLLTYWNAGAEALYGWKREEVLGKNVHDLLQTRFPGDRAEMHAALEAEGYWEANLIHTARDGRELVVATRHSRKSGSSSTLEIARDITAQLRAEEALRKTEKLAAMGRVAGIIAHEINNPLESITNAFYLLRNHPSLDEEARYFAQLGEEELIRVCHITRQTLGFYRESQHPVDVSISQLLDEVLEFQGRRFQLDHIALEKRYLSPGAIRGFPVELRQVFFNLIGNAIQAMPSGGRLRIRVYERWNERLRRAETCVSIIDTGSGVSPENARHLFEPFFSTKSNKGTGLGLWISKGIVEKHEGALQFRSVPFRGGNRTLFRVVLPGTGTASMLHAANHRGAVQPALRGSLERA